MQLDDIYYIEDCSDVIQDIRSAYSGRGMYGETTGAIVVDRYDLDKAEALLKQLEIPYRLDNMGLDYILY